jgi:hypothetical protein
MKKKLVASLSTDCNSLEMLVSFDCVELRDNVAHEDNPVPEWEYTYDVLVKWVEFVFEGVSVKIMKYSELTQKQKTTADIIAEDQAHKLYNFLND